MKLSTRLLLPLIAAVSVVMLGYAMWSLRQREEFFVTDAERETRAYATALGLALEPAVGEGEPGAVQQVIDRIDREPSIYGVILYDTLGMPTFVSAPFADATPASPAEVRAVVTSGSAHMQHREFLGEQAVVVLRPLLDENKRVQGVLEVVEPLGQVAAQLARARFRFVLNTVTLIVAMTLLLSWLVRRHLSTPLARFIRAVRALGEGDLGHRVEGYTAVGELAEVADELNRMADHLERARTDLLREAEERVTLERRLLHTEKLAEVGHLAAGLAHEIGAPLHVIRGRADLVMRRPVDAASQRRNLAIIVQQIDRIAIIVRNLLNYTQRREPRTEDVDLRDVVREVVEFVETESTRARARIVVEGDGRSAVRGDADLLYQVLLNVVLNSIHALGEADHPGVVSIRFLSDADPPEGRVVIEVEDDGPGVPAEVRDRVFEPFVSTKTPRRGTGLGLALARAVIEDHEGVIRIQSPSTQAGGTRVRIDLPGRSSRRANPPATTPARTTADA